jgi:hypothetical protein
MSPAQSGETTDKTKPFLGRGEMSGLRGKRRLAEMPKDESKVLKSSLVRSLSGHSRESGNPEFYWIPCQARNDKRD